MKIAGFVRQDADGGAGCCLTSRPHRFRRGSARWVADRREPLSTKALATPHTEHVQGGNAESEHPITTTLICPLGVGGRKSPAKSRISCETLNLADKISPFLRFNYQWAAGRPLLNADASSPTGRIRVGPPTGAPLRQNEYFLSRLHQISPVRHRQVFRRYPRSPPTPRVSFWDP